MEKIPLDIKKLKTKCLRLLAKRDHSALELKQKLKRYYSFSETDFTFCLDRLSELGYLPNEDLMALRMCQRMRAQGRGQNYISAKLKTKGLKAPLIDEDAEKQAALLFLQKKYQDINLKSLQFSQKMKIAQKLAARGFSPSLVRGLFK